MTRVAEARPRFAAREAEAVARERFGVTGSAVELPSDRDQNFRIDPGEGERAWVLKISSRDEADGVLDLQRRILERAARRAPDLVLPELRPTVDGEPAATATDAGGRAHRVRMVRWLDGRPMAGIRPRPPALLGELGAFLGTLDRALEDFSHPEADRPLHWDLARAPGTVRERLHHLGDGERRDRVEVLLARTDAALEPLRPELPTSVIHGDANDHNVLVRVAGPEALRDAVRLAGLVDFGDAVRTHTVNELAIACAYAGLDAPDPPRAVVPLIRAYAGERPLAGAEADALFALVVLRLLASVAVAAEQKAAEPDNAYLTVTEGAAWRFLAWAEETSWTRARCLFRHAACLAPSPRADAVTAWLEAHGGDAAPVLEPDPRSGDFVVLDFSVGSREWPGVPTDAGPGPWTDAIFRRMEREGVALGIGRWDEPRSWYHGDLFQGDGQEEPRTVHLGVDLFVDAGTEIRAPFAGRVHAVADNDQPLDYGPTLVLEHDAGGEPFWTLYGHLAPDVLERWSPGDAVEKGEAVARVGTYPGNGNWAPHLHLQILVDPLDLDGDYPGVAPPSERSFWLALSPDPNLLMGAPGLEPASRGRSTEEILSWRRRHLGPGLSVSYRRPLKIVRGWMQHLFDDEGRRYLDARNNVPHVGHAHPRVADAARRQAALLDTNTRYLHDALVEYTERLVDTLPDPLSVCFLVCTGSEANELALRLARSATGTRETVVLDGAYHGNTGALVEVSPYKFDGPGGRGAPDHLHAVPMPDPYRGLYRDPGPEAGARYAAHVKEVLERLDAEGRGPAAMIAEPILGCGGQVVPPDGFLATAFRHVREAGGVAIADEVQVGFGRVGTHFWAFQAQGAVPDVVTLGKPIGNGHPLAAVVTTPEVARAFDTGMEYFNTFGGSPVACRVGLAVLDVLEEEGLQERARQVGAYLADGLRELAARHPLVGDVRGAGLFLGAELVSDPEARTPAPEHARYVVERLRDHRILTGSDGPDGNVLKLKPPLPFGVGDADRLLQALDRILGEDPLRIP